MEQNTLGYLEKACNGQNNDLSAISVNLVGTNFWLESIFLQHNTCFFSLLSYSFVLIYVVFLSRRFEDMKHYAENLGTNVAAMIKVRQVTAFA